MRRLALVIAAVMLVLSTVVVYAGSLCTGALTCGVAGTGSIDVLGEIDCFTFQGTANDVVNISVREVTARVGVWSAR
jgi:hypothetical protein